MHRHPWLLRILHAAAPLENRPAAPSAFDRVEPLVEIRWQNINASASVNLATKQVNRSANMNGDAAIIDREHVIGVCPNVRVTQLLDQDGVNLIDKQPVNNNDGYFVRPNLNPSGDGGNFGINWMVPEMPAYPKRISKLSGTLAVLLARETRSVDFPIAKTDKAPEWVSLSAGLRVKLVQCDVQPGVVRVNLDVQSPHTHPFLSSGAGGPQAREAPYVFRVRVIDDLGNGLEIPGIGGGLGQGKEARFEGRFQGAVGGISTPRTFKSVRLQVVTKVDVVPVSFELTDIPFPTLAP
ncbi:MAG: hypothetical protein NTW19_22620 [Planctomycetota bacterium]|nr:hypothetical protein [Planctomycetota bacterium]